VSASHRRRSRSRFGHVCSHRSGVSVRLDEASGIGSGFNSLSERTDNINTVRNAAGWFKGCSIKFTRPVVPNHWSATAPDESFTTLADGDCQ
jgi:hypothetical protein